MKWHNSRQDWFDRADRELHNARKKARYREDPEAAAAKMREWRAEHPELQKAIEKRTREKNRKAIAERNKEWRMKNYTAVLEKQRQAHAAIRETANAARKARRDANLEAARAQQRESNYKARTVSPWFKLLAGAKARAKKYCIPFDLTEEWAISRWTGCCELTGIPFRSDERGSGPKSFAASVDQIEPRAGYVQSNCRFVLWAVNALKHDGNDTDMYLIAAALLDTKFSNETK
jgi:hypothetical protein